ncbi:MAG: hypothetical protein H7X77_01310, partial [Anaerolineae bacterium]|nr:hypothetical protein [Anaerolineae bacterium]
MSKYRAIHIIRLLMVNLLLVLAFSSGTAQILPTFRIGILDDARGPVALGAGTAISVINAAGGVQGADSTVFQLEAVTISPDADGNIEAAINNLAQANVIAVLGPV